MDFSTTIRAYGIAAALGTALLFLVWSRFYLPPLDGNGSCGVLLLCPLGWVAGSVAGSGVALSSETTIKPRYPSLVSLRIIIVGLVVLFIPPVVTAFVFVLPNSGL